MEVFSAIILLSLFNILRFLFFKPKLITTMSCGIVGFSSKTQSNVDKLALLMYHNSVKRGEDNTGFYTPDTGVQKDNKKAEEFLTANYIPKSHLFVGHVRKASVGGKLAECSHPFENENVVLVHNGTLSNHWPLATKNDLRLADYKVDSQVLAKIIDINSTKGEGFTVLSEYEGAAALLFADKRDKDQLYAYTNGERPLFYGYIGGSMYISSTEESLKLIQCVDTKEFDKEYLYSIKTGVIKNKTYYAKKEKEVTAGFWGKGNANNCANNYNIEDRRSHITNVKFKDSYLNTQIKHAPATDEFVGKWIRAAKNFDQPYGVDNRPKVTVGQWYYIIDCVAGNNYDLILVDDNNVEVTISKYQFDYKSMEFTDKYAVATVDIESKDKLIKLFEKGEYVALSSNIADDGDHMEAWHEATKKSYRIPSEFLRPIAELERIKIVQYLAEEDKPINNLPVKVENPSLIVPETDEQAYEQWLLRNRTETTRGEALQKALESIGECPFDAEVDEASVTDDNTVEAEVLEDFSLEPDELLANRILEGAESYVEDLEEIIGALEFDALKLKFAELRDYLNESYNFKKIKSDIELDNIVDNRSC